MASVRVAWGSWLEARGYRRDPSRRGDREHRALTGPADQGRRRAVEEPRLLRHQGTGRPRSGRSRAAPARLSTRSPARASTGSTRQPSPTTSRSVTSRARRYGSCCTKPPPRRLPDVGWRPTSTTSARWEATPNAVARPARRSLLGCGPSPRCTRSPARRSRWRRGGADPARRGRWAAGRAGRSLPGRAHAPSQAGRRGSGAEAAPRPSLFRFRTSGSSTSPHSRSTCCAGRWACRTRPGTRSSASASKGSTSRTCWGSSPTASVCSWWPSRSPTRASIAVRLQAYEDARLLEWATVDDGPLPGTWIVDGKGSTSCPGDVHDALVAADRAGGINLAQYEVVHAPATRTSSSRRAPARARPRRCPSASSTCSPRARLLLRLRAGAARPARRRDRPDHLHPRVRIRDAPAHRPDAPAQAAAVPVVRAAGPGMDAAAGAAPTSPRSTPSPSASSPPGVGRSDSARTPGSRAARSRCRTPSSAPSRAGWSP